MAVELCPIIAATTVRVPGSIALLMRSTSALPHSSPSGTGTSPRCPLSRDRLTNAAPPISWAAMHVGDRVDSDRLRLHSKGDNKWKTTNDAPANAKLRPHASEKRPHVREPEDQLYSRFDRCDETNTATWALLLVPVRSCVEFCASRRCELDGSHERFSRARASEKTCSAGIPR